MDLEAAGRALTKQAESAAAPRRDHAPIPDPTPAAQKPRDTGFPYIVKQTILDRDTLPGEDRPRCQRCSAVIIADSWLGHSLQHRDPRGMGGTVDPRVNQPANGITLCGSATTGCHGWATSSTREATLLGFVVASWADPETVPVKTFRGWTLLDNRGAAYLTREPVNADAHAVARRKRPL